MGNDLSRKLGLKPSLQSFTLHAPEDYEVLLPSATPINDLASIDEALEWLQVFYVDKATLNEEIAFLKKHLLPTGQLWISWPKKASDVKTDLSDNVVREIGLRAGLVDIKVAAINEIWSALKFVYPKSKR